MNLSLLDNLSGMFGGHLSAVIVFLLIILSLKIFKSIILKKIKSLAVKTKSDIDDILVGAVEEIRWPLYLFLSLYVALQFTSVPYFISKIMFYAFIVVATYYAVRVGQKLVDYFSSKVVEKRIEEEKTADVSLIKNLNVIIKYLLWVMAALLILANLGYDITALLAGLGIGGVAIAFALQNILEDIFSSISIYFDKPFAVGDFIIIGDDLGEVKKIGIKTTRIQHLQGQELVVSNRELTSTRIHNYGKMKKRRVVFKFGVKYETPVTKVKKIPSIVKKAIENVDLTVFDRAHFKDFGGSSLNFEVVYYVKTSDYNKYMDIQEAINLGIMKSFDGEGIEFAYPTQKVFLTKT